MTGKEFRETIDGRVEVKKVLKEKKEDDDDDDGEDKYETKVEAIIGDMHKFKKIAAKIKCMARSQPDDKFMLVDGLIRTGQTVAVTGDGTNDAPALNRSDVGFAMGITGTDVAKSACDIQLLDDNFCSILTAVRFGRNIYDNVRKFLQFQLTVNVVAMFIVFCGACIFAEPPLTSTQMLWVNLIMDTFAALALATEPPSDTVLERQPAKKSDLIVNAVMWRNILLQSLYQMTWLLLLLFLGKDWFSIEYDYTDPLYPTTAEINKRVANGLNGDPETMWVEGEPTNKVTMYTIIFQAFVFLQLFNQINSRKLGERDFNVFSNFFNNWMFLFITVLTFGIQVVITQYAGRYMSVVPLTVEQNLWCLAIGASCLIYSIFTKFVPARWFAWIRLEEREQSSAEEPQNFLSTIKRQRTMGSKAAISGRSQRQSTRKIKDGDDDYALN
jgi:magnesium-transporting ATPase (P-type)